MPDRTRLADFFTELGVRPGGILVIHASLGGAGLRDTDVRDALLDALGPDGTLVVPAFSPENSLTSRAYKALADGMSEDEEARFRATVPPLDPDTTPCPTMGVLAECVRTAPGAVRSGHPHTSPAGLGPRAGELLGDHDPHCHLGERSPPAKLYAADAQVLLFGWWGSRCAAPCLAPGTGCTPLPRDGHTTVCGARRATGPRTRTSCSTRGTSGRSGRGCRVIS
ncbi:AAC(3) family N-acetyltransferase [Streptomyces sp. NBC_00996]|uniref:AAC(3) family N-acetyltransferase n=1 Tax=Streptomyces sp. NBC_00996 TaxID=2903710 RepID=UPI00386B89B1